MKKRYVDLVVISDVHLGTIGCHAEELNRYLKSIEPRILILNGDILDMWQFKKYYFPESHMKVLKRIFSYMGRGTKVYYLTGNHDENLRRFSDITLGNFHLRDKLLLNLNGKTAWFFHGDVFDVTMKYSKWVAKLGSVGYDSLILLNSLVNRVSEYFGYGKMSFSKRIKNSVKTAVKFISDFEDTSLELAIENGYEYVICGHIHRPNIREYENGNGKVTYLNSGDWIENLTALEFHDGEWTLFQYEDSEFAHFDQVAEEDSYMDQTGIPDVNLQNMILENIFLPQNNAYPLRNTGNG